MPSVEPTRPQVQAFMEADVRGPVTMLNLLRFADRADYSHAPDLAPDEPISGERAYQRYAIEVQPHLERVGAQVEVAAEALDPIIGPEGERWDHVLLVRYPSREAFASMTTDPDYLAIARHRTAALADSRLVPLMGTDHPAQAHQL